MLANLMPPPSPVRVSSLEVVVAPVATSKAFVVVHPRYRAWLAKCGLVRPEAFLELPGEIVSGHQDRHVMRVELPSGVQPRVVFLKREHRVGWRVRLRNWRAGFGFVSRSIREAETLKRLDAMALPAPQWIAYGEDTRGRAFLMIDDLSGSLDLRVAAKAMRGDETRRDFCNRIGQAVAECHSRGVSTPDLAAKHVFVKPESGGVTLLDWPSATLDTAMTFKDRAAMFAQLDASLAPALATPRERMRVLRAYCRSQWGQPRLREWLAAIEPMRVKLAKRSSIREQQTLTSKRLVWLADDEAMCVTAKLAGQWSQLLAPYYTSEPAGESIIRACDGRPATLIRYRTLAPLGRLMAKLRGKSWRSPAMLLARKLMKGDGPELLAFGQKLTGPVSADSFVLLRKGEETC